MLLSQRVIRSIITRKSISGSVIKNIKPNTTPNTKISINVGICNSLIKSAALNNSLAVFVFLIKITLHTNESNKVNSKTILSTGMILLAELCEIK
jgi:hypothetical protein